jgi:hypothetical protein
VRAAVKSASFAAAHSGRDRKTIATPTAHARNERPAQSPQRFLSFASHATLHAPLHSPSTERMTVPTAREGRADLADLPDPVGPGHPFQLWEHPARMQ